MKNMIYIGVVNDEIFHEFMKLYPPKTEIHLRIKSVNKPYEYEMEEEFANDYLKFIKKYKEL